MKTEDKDAINAMIGAIEAGYSEGIVTAFWKSGDLVKRPTRRSIKALMTNVSAAIEFQRANLTSCEWRLHSGGYAYIVGLDGLIKASAHNYSPATALVVATLRAMLATNE